jgi:hypothetical protein
MLHTSPANPLFKRLSRDSFLKSPYLPLFAGGIFSPQFLQVTVSLRWLGGTTCGFLQAGQTLFRCKAVLRADWIILCIGQFYHCTRFWSMFFRFLRLIWEHVRISLNSAPSARFFWIPAFAGMTSA